MERAKVHLNLCAQLDAMQIAENREQIAHMAEKIQ